MESSFNGQAVNYNVVVEEQEMKNVSGSGIDYTSAEDKNQKFKRGLVQSVGLGCPKDDDGNYVLKIGDEILYDGYKGSPVTLETKVYSIISFMDIAIIF